MTAFASLPLAGQSGSERAMGHLAVQQPGYLGGVEHRDVAARTKMNEIATQAVGLVYGPGPFQDHHSSALWPRDSQGWFMVRNLAGIEWSAAPGFPHRGARGAGPVARCPGHGGLAGFLVRHGGPGDRLARRSGAGRGASLSHAGRGHSAVQIRRFPALGHRRRRQSSRRRARVNRAAAATRASMSCTPRRARRSRSRSRPLNAPACR